MQKQNILIVEDEKNNAKFLTNVLNDLGHNVIKCVATGVEALEVFKEKEVDFVFMDINLDGIMDGILCAKELNKHKKVPIIYITGFGYSDIISEANKTNIYGYIIKPFDEKDIEVVLGVAIQRVKDMLNLINHYQYKQEEEILKKINLGNGYIYNLENKILMLNYRQIKFTKNETKLLYFLCLNLNKDISYQVIVNSIWKNKKISFSAIRDTVLRIRKKAPQLSLKNISGVGYCLISQE